LQGSLARFRLSIDKYALIPRSFGFHGAYTYLGIVHLKRGNVAEAIICLEESWRIHPCHASMSYGLWHTLRNSLSTYPEAEGVIKQFDKISKEFGLGNIRRKYATG